MWFPSKFKRGAGLLPTAEETFGNKYTSKSSPSNSSKHAPDTEKISSSIESSRPSLPAPVPIRTRSTQIHEPTRNPSKSTTTTAPNRNAPPQRPGLQRRRTTARTRYIDMLLGLDAVSPLHNLLASLFVWILLAGYLVLPATFNKLQSRTENISDDASVIEKEALRTVRNVPLLYVAAFACGLGVAGCIWLWWKHRGNYVWVINRIFLPALLNSIAGLVSTIVNIYSAQDGMFIPLCPNPSRRRFVWTCLRIMTDVM